MIKAGILGYGNLAKGVEKAIMKSHDFELVAVFTRREPQSVKILTEDVKVYGTDKLKDFKDKIDVLLLCGGSAKDLPEQGPQMLADFNTVDSFDTHAKIPEYLEKMNNAGKKSNKLGIISVGWDPGLFSLARVYFDSILPDGAMNTFWGKGVSQGHSDAIRRIEGVLKGIQYTIPKDEAVKRVRGGENNLTAREKHLRQCFVVADACADKSVIEKSIKTMPDYFADYDTEVNFISVEEFDSKHTKMPHGGNVIRSGKTSENAFHTLELAIKMESNPEFTASILLSYARANYRLSKEGHTGALTVYDIAPKYLSPFESAEIIKNML